MEKRNIIQEICDEFLNTDISYLRDEEVKLFEEYKTQNNHLGLSNSAIIRIVHIKSMIENYYDKSVSIDEVIIFLKSAMTYDEFSILHFDDETPMKSRIEYFLLETPDEEIFRIYVTEINNGTRNIDNTDKTINESDDGSASIKPIRENGNCDDPIIIEESRKIKKLNPIV